MPLKSSKGSEAPQEITTTIVKVKSGKKPQNSILDQLVLIVVNYQSHGLVFPRLSEPKIRASLRVSLHLNRTTG